MSTIAKVQEILKDANQGEYVSLKCENDSTNINGYVVYLSKEKVDAIKLDDWTKGWPKEEPTDLGPLCFTAEQAGSTVKFYCIQEEDTPITQFYPNMNLQYSRDGQNWTVIDMAQPPADFTLVNVGDKIYFKAVTENPYGFQYDAAPCCWGMTGKIAASGNIQYLLASDGSRTDVPEHCYNSMFSGCEALTTAPALPATTLADYCYTNMFQDCTSLTKAPALPATTLSESCYNYMFAGCTSLTTAPALPATTLADWCYQNMFSGCEALTTAPALPATTLADWCYAWMFQGCTEFSDCHMKSEMQGVYNTSIHGDTTKTVVYDL